ncbi:3-oxoacyl-[acyl-carrier-protein] synthase I, chloroplastic [Tanacetum coccineum]
MEAQVHLELRHPSVITRRIIVKSPSRVINRRHQQIFASHPTTSAPNRKTGANKRVVITGMGLVSVFGNEVDSYYERLLAGESGISCIDRFDASKLTTQFAGQIRGFDSNGYIDAKTDQRLDDFQRYCIVAGKKAFEDAALRGTQRTMIDKERAGVLVGSSHGGSMVFSDGVESLIKRGYTKISPFLIPFSITSMASTLLAMDLGFTGPYYSISASCATSNSCLLAAAKHIRDGKADLMIVGGAEACITPLVIGIYAASRALSERNDDPETASRPWDKDRDGFVMGEGAGVLVMESLEHAMKRDAPIFAEYLGGATNSDAYHIINPRSNGLGLSLCIQSSLADAGVSVEEVLPTSTVIGDRAEVNALKMVFKKTKGIKMKCMIGHCMGAAGGLEAIATIKAIRTGWLHSTINQIDPEPYLDFNTVANQKQQHEINVAISNSFGIGGQNSVVAFTAFKP